MSNFTNVPLGKQVQEMDISPQFDAYSGVELIVDEDTVIFAGNRSGRVLSINSPWGTQEQAQNILNSLMSTGFQYQPYRATGAILDPAAEIGDGVTLNGTYSGIYKISRNFGSLMAADIEAPQDEEVDHEYPFEPKQDRVYKREIADAQAQITINSNAITAEVTRATLAEGNLSSSIVQNATDISAKVSKSGGSSASFGWTLTDSSWELLSGGSTVLRATASGIEITGKITATSGFIGNGNSGFTISASSMYNGMNNLNSGSQGVYIGTDGISVGGGAFKVTSAGAISANNMTLTGTLNVGGSTITAAVLRSGAQTAYSNGGWWSTAAGYASNYNDATKNGTGSYPSYFTAGYIVAKSRLTASSISCSSGLTVSGRFTFGGYSAMWRTISVNGVTYNVLTHS